MRTRKQAAICWGLTALAALAALWVLAPYHLTPEAACRAAARDDLARPVEAVCRAEDAAGDLLVLSGNGDGMLLDRCRFQWRKGWQAVGLGTGARDRTAPFSAAVGVDRSGADEAVSTDIYIFGCVEDPAVTELVIRFAAPAGGPGQTARLTADDWTGDSRGTRWFLYILEPERDGRPGACSITGRRADGTAAGTLWLTGVSPRWE